MGATITIIGIRVRSMWRCLQSSSMVSSLSVSDKLGWIYLNLERVEESTTHEEEKASRYEKETLQELNEKALTATQLCLRTKYWISFLWSKQYPRTTSSLWERLQNHYLKKSLTNRLILKQLLFLLRIHEVTPIKSHIIEFFFIINLDKIELKIEDEDQAL